VPAAVRVLPAHAAVGDCTPGADWGTVRSDLASQVVTLINSHRTGMGLVALKVSPTLTNAAVWKARHMAEYSYMAHDDPAPPVARTVADRLAACGYPSSSSGWGENIAYGYTTAASVVDAWLNSSGHRANIENASYRVTGVGAAANASGVVYWSQEFGTYDDSSAGSTSSPTVTLTSYPASSTTSTSATFGWSTSGTVTSTTCSLDGGAATSCVSPTSYSGLASGGHSFRVTVANGSGSVSATYSWTVTAPSSSAPSVALTSVPASSTTATSATFAWSTTGTVTSTTCTLDGVAAACVSPKSYAGLAPGTHSFRVTVANGAGSASSSYTWTVTSGTTYTTRPTVTLTSVPARLTAASTARFAWSTSGTVTSTTCSLDGTAATSCTSPATFTVGLGMHSFTVVVAGPGGSSTATVSWYRYA
jgi:uncharacterized protein YkwD